jgi:hypothetical protein
LQQSGGATENAALFRGADKIPKPKEAPAKGASFIAANNLPCFPFMDNGAWHAVIEFGALHKAGFSSCRGLRLNAIVYGKSPGIPPFNAGRTQKHR